MKPTTPVQHTPTIKPICTAVECYCGKHNRPWTESKIVSAFDKTGNYDERAFIVRAVNFHQVLLNIATNLHYEKHTDIKQGCEVCETLSNAKGD